MTTAKPGLAEVLQEALDASLGRVRVSIPGRVQSYDETTQTATVRPTVRCFYLDDDRERVTVLPPAIPDVQVAWPSATGYSLTWPIAQGDPVVLVFCDRSIAEWKITGEADCEPQDSRRFDWTDAVAIPGGRPLSDVVPAAGVDTGAAVLRGGSIKLGSSAAVKWIALANDVLTRLNLLENAFNAHVHIYVAPAIPAAPAPVAPTVAPVTPTILADIASAKVKSE